MPGYTISDFVSDIWLVAKEELSSIDPDYVATLDSEIRLNKLGLVAEKPSFGESKPKRPLPKKWHQVLEACTELELRADCVKTSVKYLAPPLYKDKTPEQAGREAIYHFRSWFVHAAAVAEQIETVVEKVIELLPLSQREKVSLKAAFKSVIREKITDKVAKQRHDYLHGGRPSWPSGITEQELWEGAVAVGLTPDRVLRESVYPIESEKVKTGKRTQIETATDEIFSRAGEILGDLKVELTSHGSPKADV